MIHSPTDTLFIDSPDAGHPACLCSRCGNIIGEDEIPMREWPSDVATSLISTEYRYCDSCQVTMGLVRMADAVEFDDEEFLL